MAVKAIFSNTCMKLRVKKRLEVEEDEGKPDKICQVFEKF